METMMSSFSYGYKGKTPVHKGDAISVEIMQDQWIEATVAQALATQFTARTGKNILFFFYSDRGVTWKRIVS